MATGDPASNGSHHTQDLIERAADQMAQLDLVGKTLNSNGSADVVDAVISTTENGVKEPPPVSAPPEPKTPAKKPAVSTPGSGRTSRKPSTSASKSPIDPKPEEQPKKLPMNKIKVGSAASPNIKQVKSKIGSLSTASTYKPSGGNVKIESKKLNWKAESKIGSMGNVSHTPGGGAVRIETKKVDLKNVQSRVGSMGNVKHRPGGGDKKIFDDKEYLKRCSPSSSAGLGSKTPSEGVGSPKGAMSPTPMSPAPGDEADSGNGPV